METHRRLTDKSSSLVNASLLLVNSDQTISSSYSVVACTTMRVSRDDVYASKRRLLYMLFEFVHVSRGKWTTAEAQKTALSTFLLSDRLPPRMIKDGAHFVDGGSWTVESVLEAIRTGVREHARTESIKRNPVDSFFEQGRQAITDYYYQKCCEATDAYVAGLSKSESQWSERRQLDQVEIKKPTASVSFPAQDQLNRQEQDASSTEMARSDHKRSARGLPKEVEELKANCYWKMLDQELLKGELIEGRRKRSYREFLGRPKQSQPQSEHRTLKRPSPNLLRQMQPKKAQSKRTQSKRTRLRRAKSKQTHSKSTPSRPTVARLNPQTTDFAEHETDHFVRETPASSTETMYEAEEKSEQEWQVEASPGTTGIADKSLPAPERRSMSAAVVAKYITDIDHQLEPQLRKAFEASGLDWTTPVTFHSRPSSNLRDLYQFCLGRNWHKAAKALRQMEPISSLEFLISLVGAGIYSRVLSVVHRDECLGLASYWSNGHLCQTVHRSGKAHRRQTTAAKAKDAQYRNSVLIPLAKHMAGIRGMAVYEHLSAQAMCADIAKSGVLPAMFQDSITSAFETAMELAGELDACDDDVQPTWFETGCTYNGETMKPSDRGTPPGKQPPAAVLTLLPGVDVRHAGGNWITFAKATVHVLE